MYPPNRYSSWTASRRLAVFGDRLEIGLCPGRAYASNSLRLCRLSGEVVRHTFDHELNSWCGVVCGGSCVVNGRLVCAGSRLWCGG